MTTLEAFSATFGLRLEGHVSVRVRRDADLLDLADWVRTSVLTRAVPGRPLDLSFEFRGPARVRIPAAGDRRCRRAHPQNTSISGATC